MKAALFLAILVLLFLPAHAVFTPIRFPHTIYGVAYVNGAVAPGATVACYINGARHLAGAQNGATPDATAAQNGEYLVNVGGDDGSAPKEGAANGDTITFSINGQATAQSVVFSSGGTAQLDLYLGAAPPAPPPAPSSGSGSNSQTQNQNNPLPPAPPSPPTNVSRQNNSSNPPQPAANLSRNDSAPKLPSPSPAANESNNGSSLIEGVQNLFAGNSSNSSQEVSPSRAEALAIIGLSGAALLALSVLLIVFIAMLFFAWKKLKRGGL